METAPELPAYEDVERLLHEASAPTGAAEAHGILAGALCAPAGARVALQSLILGREHAPSSAPVQMLAALRRATAEQLHGVECEFELLLPGEDHSLAEQVEGLADWCRGYLLGLHAGGVADTQALPGDAGEFLRDVARISETEVDAAVAGEQEEKAFAEIVEYLRVGVQLVFEELQPPAARH